MRTCQTFIELRKSKPEPQFDEATDLTGIRWKWQVDLIFCHKSTRFFFNTVWQQSAVVMNATCWCCTASCWCCPIRHKEEGSNRKFLPSQKQHKDKIMGGGGNRWRGGWAWTVMKQVGVIEHQLLSLSNNLHSLEQETDVFTYLNWWNGHRSQQTRWSKYSNYPRGFALWSNFRSKTGVRWIRRELVWQIKAIRRITQSWKWRHVATNRSGGLNVTYRQETTLTDPCEAAPSDGEWKQI